MKTKLLLSSLTLALSVCAQAQEVTYAPVISATPVERQFTSYELTEPVCTVVQVPVERRVPVYRDVPVRDTASPLLGMIVGAAIANQALRGSDARPIGTMMGASLGYSAMDGNVGSRRVVEYQTEIHYENRQSCNRRSELVTRNVIDGYRVVYEFQGQHRTIMMKTNPGTYVKVVTSHQIAP